MRLNGQNLRPIPPLIITQYRFSMTEFSFIIRLLLRGLIYNKIPKEAPSSPTFFIGIIINCLNTPLNAPEMPHIAMHSLPCTESVKQRLPHHPKRYYREIKRKHQQKKHLKICTFHHEALSLSPLSPDGGIGRRAGLKHQWIHFHAGSIPALGTSKSAK